MIIYQALSKSNTTFKLEEAEFFLNRAKENPEPKNVFVFYMDAFFTAAASIRVGDGVMVNEYQSFPGFKNWRDQAIQKLEADFSYNFWVVKTRNRIIHLIGNIGYETRRKVTTRVVLEKNEGGGWGAYRDDPPPDNSWRFAEKFDNKEGGKVIVDRCEEYLAALTQMVNDWEKGLPPPPSSP